MALLNAAAAEGRANRTVAGAPSNGTDEVQTITIGGTPTGGSFKLVFKGQKTTPIDWTATDATLVAAVDAALGALTTIGGASNVTAAAGTLSSGIGTITVTFVAAQGKKAQPLMTVESSLTGTSPTIAVTETTPGVTATHRGAPTGAKLVRSSNGVEYRNTGTPDAPTWTQQTTPSAEMAALEAAIPVAAVADLGAQSALTAVPGTFADLPAVVTYLTTLRSEIQTILAADRTKINDLLAKLRTATIITP